MSILDDINDINARVCVRPEGQEPFESYISGVIGNGTLLERAATKITVEDSRCPYGGIPATRVWRIYRVNTHDGRTYEGLCSGVVHDLVRRTSNEPDGPITHYFMRPLHEQRTGEYVTFSQIELL